MNQYTKKDLIFVMLYSLISLIIGLLFIFKQFGLSSDSMEYIDIAESIAQGNGFIVHVAWSCLFATNAVSPACLEMPLYPFLISLLIKIGVNSTFSARLVPVIFLALIPFPMYYLTKNLYGRTIAHASTLYLTFSWVFIYCGSYAWTETTFIFFILMSILFLSKLVIPSDESVVIRSKIITFISGIFIGFAYLTKGNGVLLIPVAFFVIFFLLSPIRDRNRIKHKIGLFLLLLIGFSLVSSLWWIRNYFIFGNPLYYGASSVFHIPTFQSFFSSSYPYIYLFPLVLCLPYSLKYLFDTEERKKFLLLVSLPVITTLFFMCWGHYDVRYASPTFPFLIIIGMKSLMDMTEWLKKRFERMDILSTKTIMITLLILFILPQVVFDVSYFSTHGTPNFLNRTHEKSILEKMELYESIGWIKTNTNQDDVLLSDVHRGIYYYTKRNTVWTGKRSFPGQLKYSSFMDTVNRLNISYIILFKDSYRVRREYGGDFVYNLSRGCDVPSNLNIVYNRDDAIIYRCENSK